MKDGVAAEHSYYCRAQVAAEEVAVELAVVDNAFLAVVAERTPAVLEERMVVLRSHIAEEAAVLQIVSAELVEEEH